MHLQLPPDLVTLLTGIQSAISDMDAKLTAVHAELRSKPATPPEPRVSYLTKEAAKLLGKAEYTLREWCNNGRINATKREERRGGAALWSVSAEELARIRDEGLLPPDPNRNIER
jgi:hypothetical protein